MRLKKITKVMASAIVCATMMMTSFGTGLTIKDIKAETTETTQSSQTTAVTTTKKVDVSEWKKYEFDFNLYRYVCCGPLVADEETNISALDKLRWTFSSTSKWYNGGEIEKDGAPYYIGFWSNALYEGLEGTLIDDAGADGMGQLYSFDIPEERLENAIRKKFTLTDEEITSIHVTGLEDIWMGVNKLDYDATKKAYVAETVYGGFGGDTTKWFVGYVRNSDGSTVIYYVDAAECDKNSILDTDVEGKDYYVNRYYDDDNILREYYYKIRKWYTITQNKDGLYNTYKQLSSMLDANTIEGIVLWDTKVEKDVEIIETGKTTISSDVKITDAVGNIIEVNLENLEVKIDSANDETLTAVKTILENNSVVIAERATVDCYEISLESLGEKVVLADGSIEFTIPTNEGITAENYTVDVYHIIVDADGNETMEKVDAKLVDGGLQITAKGFSPYVIIYTPIVSESENGITDENNNGGSEDANTSDSNSDVSPATGDTNPVIPMLAMMILAMLIVGVVLGKKDIA